MGSFHSNNNNSAESSSEDENFIPGVADDNKYDQQMDRQIVVTDATETQATLMGPLKETITPERVDEIEKMLNFAEKVSMVFILYENAEVALQYLLQLQGMPTRSVLGEWARSCCTKTNWQDKFLESLAIVQNFRVLSKLGFNKNEVCGRYLPYNFNVALSVDLCRKKLYRICEELNNGQIELLLECVKQDFRDKDLPFIRYSLPYMEMYFLHWSSIKYITQTDMTNLNKAFKILNVPGLYEHIQSLNGTNDHLNRTENVLLIPDSNDADINSNLSLPRERSISMSSSSSSIQQDRISRHSFRGKNYDIDAANPGVCLIINQECFYTEPDIKYKHLLSKTKMQLEQRQGTVHDKNKLKETFEKYKFEIIVKENRTHVEIVNDIKTAALKVTTHSSFIVCILSHGLQGSVFGSNSIPIEVAQIRKILMETNVKNLRRKPKVLILQACQGQQCQQVVEDDEEFNDDIEMDGGNGAVPKSADLLVFWATVPGYGAVRDKRKGSWFIQSLCNMICENAHEKHFEEICTLVKNDVTDMRWETKENIRAMVPYQESTLTKFFYLPPMLR